MRRPGAFAIYIRLNENLSAWIGAFVFSLVGIGALFFLPPLVEPGPDRAFVAAMLWILGAVFSGLALLLWVTLLGNWYCGAYHPKFQPVWNWWAQFVGGMLAAALFAIPATLAFPVFLVAYLFRPNALFPAGNAAAMENLWVTLLVSMIGLATLAFMVWLGRSAYRSRPLPDESIEEI